MLTARVERWRREGEMAEVDGRCLFFRARGGEGPTLLLLHGFPTSSYDWRRLLELCPERAAIAFDCLGFGLSEKPIEHVYSLAWQADAAEELVRRAGSPRVFVIAHDMGTSVATELMARDLRGELSMELDGALIFNGSILLDRASPTVGQKLLRSRFAPLFARLTTERIFRAQLGRVFSEGYPLTEEEAADQWSLVAHRRGHRIAHRLIHYMDERERLTERWHGAFRDWPGRLSLAWGLKDPVATPAVLAGLRTLRPRVAVAELPDLGHYPQIERAEEIAVAVEQALGT